MLADPEFSACLEQAQDAIFSRIHRKVSNEDAARDILQNTLAKAWAKRATLRDPAKIRAWLDAIARNSLKDWLQRSKKNRFERIYESVFEEPEAPRSLQLLQDFDDTFELIASLSSDKKTLIVLALHYVMNCKVQEISKITGYNTKTVYSILTRVSRKGATKPKASDPRAMMHAKFGCVVGVAALAMSPVSGTGFRNYAMMREACAMSKLLALRYPQEADILRYTSMLASQTASYHGYDDMRPVDWSFYRRDRALWDRALLAESAQWRAQCLALQPEPWMRLTLLIDELFYMPPDIQAVNFPRLYDAARQLMRTGRNAVWVLTLARMIGLFKGSLAGARFLEENKNRVMLKDNPATYRILGNLYFDAGYWTKARASFRKFLRWPCNATVRDYVERQIAVCSHSNRQAARLVKFTTQSI